MNKIIYILLIIIIPLSSFSRELDCQYVKSFILIAQKKHVNSPEINISTIKNAAVIFIENIDYNKNYLLKSEYDSLLKEIELNNKKYISLYNNNTCFLFSNIEKKLLEGEKRYFKIIKDKINTKAKKYTIKRKESFLTSEKELSLFIEKFIANTYFLHKDNIKKYKKQFLEKQSFVLDLEKNRSSRIVNAFIESFDPHSQYIPDDFADEYTDALSGQFTGIGVNLIADQLGLRIEGLIKDSPASKKLCVGEYIIGVNEIKVNEDNFSEFRKELNKPVGTNIKLKILDIKKKEKIVDIEIDHINNENLVLSHEIINYKSKNIVIFKIPSFYFDLDKKTGVYDDFMSHYNQVKEKQKIDFIIIDLRNNPGGSVQEVLNLSGAFLGYKPIIYTRESDNKIEPMFPLEFSFFPKIKEPLIVLTNKRSASASEIFAGAIKDYSRGLIIGDETTYGKGTMQSIIFHFREAGLGLLKVTTGQFYLPSGISNQEKGVLSDIVLQKEDDYDLEKDQLFHIKSDKIPVPNPDYEMSTKLKIDKIKTVEHNIINNKDKKNDYVLEKSKDIAINFLNIN